MAFQARKTRERRKPDPVGVGKPLTPSAAIRVWYRNELNMMVNAMLEDYRVNINATLENPEVERFYAEDAATNYFQKMMSAMKKKWTEIFAGFASKVAPEFTGKVDKHSKATTWFSLSTEGVEAPVTTYNENVLNTLISSTEYNRTLITRIHEEVDNKIYNAVMNSLTSPNPEEQGSSGIQNALKDAKQFSHQRIDLITRDQTSKLNASLSTERMKQNGVTHFEWAHSSAGKVPRESHMKMNGHIFKINDPQLWEVGGEFGLLKGDLGPPGWAINCRCRAKPVIGPVSDDDDED